MTLVCSTSITPSDFCGSLMRPKPSFLISSPKYAIFFLPSYYIPENSPYQYHQISNISDTDISRTVIFLLQEKNLRFSYYNGISPGGKPFSFTSVKTMP